MKKAIYLMMLLVPGLSHAQTWTTLNVGTPSEVMCMSFPSNDTGYVLMGNGQIRKTYDGAANWTPCTTVPPAPSEVEFVSGNRGVAIGNTWTDIYLTTDGGQTWNSVLNVPGQALYNISFANSLVGYASANNAATDSVFVYKTIDGGSTWTPLPVILPPIGVFFPLIYFTSPLNGFISLDVYTYRTLDGGLTWTSEYMDPNADVIYDIHSPDGVNLFCGYWSTAFTISNDGGDNWTPGTNTNYPGYGVYCTSATHGYYCGGNGFGSGAIEETNNGGVTWTPVHTGNSFWCMDFPSPTTGYVGGTNGVIVKYSGPTSVEEQSVPSMVCYPNPATDVLTLENLQIGETVTLFDMTGQVVREFVATNTRMQLSVAELASGVYFVGSAVSTRMQKVVVQH